LKNKIKHQAKQIAWRALTTVILTLTAVITVWAYAAFTEPLAGPNDSDQDFLQNILGANNNDNDFNSSNVVANLDGSIIERLEGIASSTCGNGLVESGEGCDDSGTSWTSGACAGDCSGINYWSNPSVASVFLGQYSPGQHRYCQEHGYNVFTSAVTTSSTVQWGQFGTFTDYGAVYSLVANSLMGPWSWSYYSVTATGGAYTRTALYTSQIWCAN